MDVGAVLALRRASLNVCASAAPTKPPRSFLPLSLSESDLATRLKRWAVEEKAGESSDFESVDDVEWESWFETGRPMHSIRSAPSSEYYRRPPTSAACALSRVHSARVYDAAKFALSAARASNRRARRANHCELRPFADDLHRKLSKIDSPLAQKAFLMPEAHSQNCENFSQIDKLPTNHTTTNGKKLRRESSRSSLLEEIAGMQKWLSLLSKTKTTKTSPNLTRSNSRDDYDENPADSEMCGDKAKRLANEEKARATVHCGDTLANRRQLFLLCKADAFSEQSMPPHVDTTPTATNITIADNPTTTTTTTLNTHTTTKNPSIHIQNDAQASRQPSENNSKLLKSIENTCQIFCEAEAPQSAASTSASSVDVRASNAPSTTMTTTATTPSSSSAFSRFLLSSPKVPKATKWEAKPQKMTVKEAKKGAFRFLSRQPRESVKSCTIAVDDCASNDSDDVPSHYHTVSGANLLRAATCYAKSGAPRRNSLICITPKSRQPPSPTTSTAMSMAETGGKRHLIQRCLTTTETARQRKNRSCSNDSSSISFLHKSPLSTIRNAIFPANSVEKSQKFVDKSESAFIEPANSTIRTTLQTQIQHYNNGIRTNNSISPAEIRYSVPTFSFHHFRHADSTNSDGIGGGDDDDANDKSAL